MVCDSSTYDTGKYQHLMFVIRNCVIRILYNLIHIIISYLKKLISNYNMSESASHRPMKYPYTLTAKIAQFPYKYYIKHSWLIRYWFISIGVSLPIFYKIQKLSYSPENVKKWEQIHREMFTGHH